MESAAGAGRATDDFVRLKTNSPTLEEDDYVQKLLLTLPPRDRLDWEETISAMARSADLPDLPGELPLRPCGSTASMKVKHVKKMAFTKGHFPKLAECAHFHYENVDFGSIQLALTEEQSDTSKNGADTKELVFLVQVSCQGRSWIVKRSYEDFRVLDKHLHLCIYDRRFSQLAELPRTDWLKDSAEAITQMLMAYLARLSVIADNKINCGPALTWMEIDNKGNHLLVHEESSINVPAIAAAHVIKRYIAQAADELSFEVGDIVSVIDMPPKEDTTWWRGKHGFQVGFFPSECVELINDKVPHSVTSAMPKPVSKKHGKLITFLRTFMKSRPTKQKLKQRGILKERVFGCDLGEHLLNSGHDVPQVLKSCTEFIERHGVVDGIYRLSGIASNIQKLRHEFDSEQIPELTKDLYLQDIHCVGSLCKLYFRELPNPLLTYQLYEKFSDSVSVASDEDRLIKIHDVIQQLPPPHYRTLEFLMRHLARLATFSYITNMHTKNLAIVWAPNLLRSRQIESACFSGTAAFMEVRIQSVVVEFILNHVDMLFSSKISSVMREGAGHASLSRPKSLLVSSPSTKLLTLEEAQARTQVQIISPMNSDSKYIEVGDGPAALQGRFHTVIDFPIDRKRTTSKPKKSPVGTWRSFFNLGKSSSIAKRKLHRNPSEPTQMKSMVFTARGDSGTLRSAKSEESLSSLHNVEGESKVYRPRRPRSSSDALSVSFNAGGLPGLNHCNSYDNLPNDESEREEGVHPMPALLSSRMEDVELSPPDMGAASLDFDPMSFQCSPPRTEHAGPDSISSPVDSSASGKDKSNSSKKESDLGSACLTPGSATSSEPVSHSPDKLISPFFSPDLSPTDEKLAKPTSFAEKVVHAFSPKIGRKSPKSPLLTISEPMTISVPTRVSEMIGSMATVSLGSSPPQTNPAGSGNVSKSPPQMMSMLLKTSDMQLPEGCRQEIHTKLSAAGSEAREQIPDWHDQTSHYKAIATTQSQAASKWESSNWHELTNQNKTTSSTGSQIGTPGQSPDWYELTDQNKTAPPTNSQAGIKGQSSNWHELTNQNKTTPSTNLQIGAPGQILDWHELTNQNKTTSFAHSQSEAKGQSPDWHELTNQNKTIPSTHSQTVTPVDYSAATPVESPQEAPPVSSVPLLPPPPPPKSAARLLALALAESAQQATAQSQKKPQPGRQISGDHNLHNIPVTDPCSVSASSAPPTTASYQLTGQPTVESQPATGQVPPGTTAGPTASGQVRTAVSAGPSLKTSESRAPEQSGSTFISDNSYVTRPTAVMAIHSGHHEKTRDNVQAPAVKPRADSVPVDRSAYSNTPQVPHLRSVENRVPPSHSMSDTINASNFHSFLASTTIPSSIEDALPPPPPPKPPFLCQSHPYHSKLENLPDLDKHFQQKNAHSAQSLVYQCRAESVPQHLSCQSKSESTSQHLLYGTRPDNIPSATSRFNSFSSQPKAVSVHLSKSRLSRSDYVPAMRAFVCPHSQFEEPVYPTIRRVHSLHVPPSSVRSVPISRTEVPPADELFYYQRPIYQYKPCHPPPLQSDYHVTQLQPYFENGRVQYRYSPYSTSGHNLHGTDGVIYDFADPYGSIRLRQFHSFTSRDIPPYTGRFQGKVFPYPNAPPYPRSGAHANAMSREHSFVSRDVPPSPDVKMTHMMWDPEELEKSRFQSIRREIRSRQKNKGLVMSQYDNVTPVLQEEFGGLEILHSRSKSDPGKTGALASEGKERWYPATSKTPDPDPPYSYQQSDCELDSGAHIEPLALHHGSFGNGQLEKPAPPPIQSTSRTRRLHESPCDLSRYDSSQRPSADLKGGQIYSAHTAIPAGYGLKHRPDHTESRTYPSATGKYVLSSHEPLRSYEDSFRAVSERPELERPKVRGTGGDHSSRDYYSEEEEDPARPLVSNQPERSYSTRFQQQLEPLVREQSLSYPYPCLGHSGSKRHSTLTVMSQYDNLDDYHTLSQQQRGGLGGSAPFVPLGFSHPQGRTFSTALGQGSFVTAELALQRSEAEVHVE
ncbi:rho GTPase-activating protein 32 isoform X1 [Hemiscyllium ocellatum]|uniref:rho GTPase-activating protein 32 isoform X1 n=3 Tax=Hemiscyllium ocellatum TaxID=170820 RepID=UPI002966E733|nr:rho GTPase-activating protein 32 isoform X1 [Hemiscyllium ocellatum]XP_060702643.1 rho GTPase-activating protein 32 isoform X1 [Hemiscyllium ocellatum]XP_060702644.1 rho GTPase-activating protein 32 isoform X1 [Hemiscyllium ocellatum]